LRCGALAIPSRPLSSLVRFQVLPPSIVKKTSQGDPVGSFGGVSAATMLSGFVGFTAKLISGKVTDGSLLTFTGRGGEPAAKLENWFPFGRVLMGPERGKSIPCCKETYSGEEASRAFNVSRGIPPSMAVVHADRPTGSGLRPRMPT